jgi:hypothetical protein
MLTSARTEACRRHTASAESWLRKLVDRELHSRYGPQYLSKAGWKRALADYVATQIKDHPGKFAREIDATTFEQLADIVCHPNHWAEFQPGLKEAYPDGPQEARTFLDRLRNVRNDVAHGRECSSRQLERARCYSNDIADSVKNYFREMNLEKEFNVPTFVAFHDNQGNAGPLTPGAYFRTVNLSDGAHKRLYPGGTLLLEVEVDASFDSEKYRVNWILKTAPGGGGDGSIAKIELTQAHVGERMEVQFQLATTNSWHRDSGGKDDVLDVHYRVLPPIA